MFEVDSVAWSGAILVSVWRQESGYGSLLIEDEGGCCGGYELPWVYGREKSSSDVFNEIIRSAGRSSSAEIMCPGSCCFLPESLGCPTIGKALD